ncbi:MAG: hypothetical protein ACFFCS_21400 [Candidatus Hodarchaeota archaeon]
MSDSNQNNSEFYGRFENGEKKKDEIEDIVISDEDVLAKKDDISEIRAAELWDAIGFHRPVGGFWYKIILEVGILIIPIFITEFVLKVMYPYPTSKGYNTTFTSIFILIFQVFDLGTSNTIARYVADANIKDPRRMVNYIQYFIWYQMITGLVQITAISTYCLYIVPNTELAYGIWIMLLVITKQWPGFPGVFKGVLNSLQQYNRKAMIDFIQGEGFQRITEIVFVLLGRWLGSLDVRIGELMGIAMGAVLGLYLDDIIATFVAGYYLTKALKPYGITFKTLFRVDFDRKLVIECSIFGIKTGLPGVLFASTQFISLNLMLNYIPQYTTYVVLADMAIMLAAMTQRLVNQDFTPIFTEAYQNGMKKLCEYYNAHAIRFICINLGFALAIMLVVFSVLPDVFPVLGLDRYILTIPFFYPALLNRASRSFTNYPGGLLIAANKPTLAMIIKIAEEGGKIFLWWFTIVVLRVQDLGIMGVVYVITLTEFPAKLATTIATFTYLDRRVFRMKINVWQTLVVPIATTAILYGIFTFFKETLLWTLMEINFYLALGLAVVVLFILVFGLYFPITIILGGWDDNSVRDFVKAVKMAGPSKFLVVGLKKNVLAVAKKAKLHNKFKIDDEAAYRELVELVALREKGRRKAKKKIAE